MSQTREAKKKIEAPQVLGNVRKKKKIFEFFQSTAQKSEGEIEEETTVQLPGTSQSWGPSEDTLPPGTAQPRRTGECPTVQLPGTSQTWGPSEEAQTSSDREIDMDGNYVDDTRFAAETLAPGTRFSKEKGCFTWEKPKSDEDCVQNSQTQVLSALNSIVKGIKFTGRTSQISKMEDCPL